MLLKWILFNQKFIKTAFFLGDRMDRILYYDCTNYYFEIEQEDGDKKYGKSKEHRPNPIIQMGLFTDGDGIPLAFSLFPGNQNEQKSLKPLETKILQQFGCDKFIYLVTPDLLLRITVFLITWDRGHLLSLSPSKSCLLKTGHGL